MRERRKGWDEVNVGNGGEKGEKGVVGGKVGNGIKNSKGSEGGDGEDEWMDEDEGGESTEETKEKVLNSEKDDIDGMSEAHNVMETSASTALDNGGVHDHEATPEDDNIT